MIPQALLPELLHLLRSVIAPVLSLDPPADASSDVAGEKRNSDNEDQSVGVGFASSAVLDHFPSSFQIETSSALAITPTPSTIRSLILSLAPRRHHARSCALCANPNKSREPAARPRAK